MREEWQYISLQSSLHYGLKQRGINCKVLQVHINFICISICLYYAIILQQKKQCTVFALWATIGKSDYQCNAFSSFFYLGGGEWGRRGIWLV